jgi:single-strand DNA-binding protein
MQPINKVVIAGKLGRDPEVGATLKGTLVAKFSVAVNAPGSNGQSRTVWFPCVALREQALWVRENLGRGDAVYVEGALEPYEYLARGEKRRTQAFRVLVDVVRPLEAKARIPVAPESLGFDFAPA